SLSVRYSTPQRATASLPRERAEWNSLRRGPYAASYRVKARSYEDRMRAGDLTTTCSPTDPPPWWAGVFAMDARWWLLLVAAFLLCRWMIKRDLPGLQPSGHLRVGLLWALSIIVGFGGILCFEAIAAYTGPLFAWYSANLQRLAGQGCPTVGLDI